MEGSEVLSVLMFWGFSIAILLSLGALYLNLLWPTQTTCLNRMLDFPSMLINPFPGPFAFLYHFSDLTPFQGTAQKPPVWSLQCQ